MRYSWIAAPLILSACVMPQRGYWVNGGAATGMVDQDRTACIAEAYQVFPPVAPAQVAQAPQPQRGMTCIGDRGYIQCNPSGMQFQTLLDPESRQQALNYQNQQDQARLQTARACMDRKGWTWRNSQ